MPAPAPSWSESQCILSSRSWPLGTDLGLCISVCVFLIRLLADLCTESLDLRKWQIVKGGVHHVDRGEREGEKKDERKGRYFANMMR